MTLTNPVEDYVNDPWKQRVSYGARNTQLVNRPIEQNRTSFLWYLGRTLITYIIWQIDLAPPFSSLAASHLLFCTTQPSQENHFFMNLRLLHDFLWMVNSPNTLSSSFLSSPYQSSPLKGPYQSSLLAHPFPVVKPAYASFCYLLYLLPKD